MSKPTSDAQKQAVKKITVVKGRKANESFAFRISKEKRIEVGEKPVDVPAHLVAGYVSDGFLTQLSPEQAREIRKKLAERDKSKQQKPS